MSDTDTGGSGRLNFDARVTGWTIEDVVDECYDLGENPYRQVYYTTYSDIYHTNPECPHIADSERLHYASNIGVLDGIPWAMGGERFANELDECNWCQTHQPEGKFIDGRYLDTG